jgi:hypothetical protein
VLIPAPEGGPRGAAPRVKTSTMIMRPPAAMAWRTMIGRGVGIDFVVRCRRIDCRHWDGHQRLGTRNVGFAAGAGQQSVVADAMKPLWQNVELEAPDELVGAERHCAVPCLPVAAAIFVAEGHAALVESNETLVLRPASETLPVSGR